MKKILSILMVLALVMPAFAADVDFVATDNGDGSFTISYAGVAPRGIGLAVSTDGTTVGDATLGENGDVLSADALFNCYMDYASTDPGAYILGAGHPLAAPGAAGEPTYPASVFSVCMGALDEGGNQNPGPASSADLVTIQLSGTFPSDVTIDEDTFRGSVVGDVALTTNLPIVVTVTDGPGECVSSSAPFYADWVALGSPACWCYAQNCLGDVDGAQQGNIITGYSWVSTDDLSVFLAAYNVKEAPKGPGILSVTDGICADFSRGKQGNVITGYSHVSTDDLSLLLASYNVKEPTKGPGIGDCSGPDYVFFITP